MQNSQRKEKARIAARVRRSQEANIIMEMANELLISPSRRVDKATIVKLSIDYIRAFEILCRQTKIRATNPADNNIINTKSNNNNCISIKRCNPSLSKEQQHRQTQPTPKRLHEDHQKGAEELVVPQPKLSTRSIFAPKTEDMDAHYLMIKERDGTASFVFKPDTEVLEDEDLTHLAPQAGEIHIPLEVEPLEGIEVDSSLFSNSLPSKRGPLMTTIDSSQIASKSEFYETTYCYIGQIGTVD